MFENLSEVRRANTKTSSTGARKAQFKLKVNEAKSTLIFSIEQFEDMNIADNSLSQFVDANTKTVFLAVMPGDSGTFAKTSKKGVKGKKFKNEKFVASLTEFGYDFGAISLEKVGEEDGKTLYQITGNGAALISDNVVEGEAEVAAEMTQGQQDVANFQDAAPARNAVEEGTDVAQDESIEDALTESAEEELEF